MDCLLIAATACSSFNQTGNHCEQAPWTKNKDRSIEAPFVKLKLIKKSGKYASKYGIQIKCTDECIFLRA